MLTQMVQLFYLVAVPTRCSALLTPHTTLTPTSVVSCTLHKRKYTTSTTVKLYNYCAPSPSCPIPGEIPYYHLFVCCWLVHCMYILL